MYVKVVAPLILLVYSALVGAQDNLVLHCKFTEGVSRSGKDMTKNDPDRDIIIRIDLQQKTCFGLPCRISNEKFEYSDTRYNFVINRNTGFARQDYPDSGAYLRYECAPSRPKF